MASALEIISMSRHLGAEIGGIDLSKPVDAATIAAIRRAWYDNLVLVFRDQSLSDRQLLDFSLALGPINDTGGDAPAHAPGFPQVLVVSNVVENGKPIGILGYGEAFWHTDMSFMRCPPSASLLYSLEIPREGGDTSFLDMYTAFETLPEPLRMQVTRLRLHHDGTLNSAGKPRRHRNPANAGNESFGTLHPLVCRHPETHRPALYLGRRPKAFIDGMDAAASEDLLNRLWAHCQSSEAVYRHRWRGGDLIIWDNRCVMHRRDAFDPSSRRIMHRTEIAGTQPVPASPMAM